MQQQSDDSQQLQTVQDTWYARLPFNYGWVIAAISGIGVLMSGPGQTYVVSVIIDPLIEETGWSRTLVSGLYSAGSISAIAGALLAGRSFDRFGARASLSGITVLFGLAAFLMSKISSPVHLYLGFFAIRSLGQTAMTLVSTSMVSLWFIRLRGRATAITMVAGPLGQALFPPILTTVIAAYSWRDAWVWMAIAIWAIMLPPAILLVRNSPESIGLLPDGVRRRLTRATPAPPDTEIHWNLKEAVKTRSFWLIWVAGFPLSLIGTALTFHHISLMSSKGIEQGTAAGILSVMAVVALLGTFIAGWMLDRFPNRYVLAAGLALLVAAMLLTFVIASPWQGFLYGILMGLSQGLVMTANIVIWPNYFGRRNIGGIRGAAAVGMVVSGGLGPLPFGYLFDLTDSYDVAILGFLALPLLCVIASILAVPPTKREQTASPKQLLKSK
ncbi:MAG: MFS transporter [Chloroflexi bacterium]|nr:MFS transporter [Chloroflexota bacterium]